MDTSHNNRVSEMLEDFDKLPCCYFDGSEDYEVNRSSWTFDDLVARPPFFDTPTKCEDYVFTTVERTSRVKDSIQHSDPYETLTHYNRCTEARFTAKQNHAVDAFQVLHDSVLRDLGSMRPSIADMKQYAACFDDLYFDGRIMPRCSIQWAEMAEESVHAQCHTVSIHIDRTSNFNEEDDQSYSPGRSGHLLIVLLHEMCHAWILIFSDNSKISLEEAFAQRGFQGHGLSWEMLMHKCFKEGLHHFNLPAFELKGGHCPRDTDDGHIPMQVEEDDAVIWVMEILACLIEGKAISLEILTKISQILKISKEAAMYYDALLGSHYEPLEALWFYARDPEQPFSGIIEVGNYLYHRTMMR